MRMFGDDSTADVSMELSTSALRHEIPEVENMGTAPANKAPPPAHAEALAVQLNNADVWRHIDERLEVIKAAYDTAKHVRRRGDNAGARAIERGARSSCEAVAQLLEAAAEVDVRASAAIRPTAHNGGLVRGADRGEASTSLSGPHRRVDAWLPEPSIDAIHITSTAPRAAPRPPATGDLACESRDVRGGAGDAEEGVNIKVVTMSMTCRRIDAKIHIDAHPREVYGALVDYGRLGDFVPGLTDNRVLEEHPHGCKILQASQKNIGLLRIRVETVIQVLEVPHGLGDDGELDIENLHGMPGVDRHTGGGAAGAGGPGSDGVERWPLQPAFSVPGIRSMDICFAMTESRELDEFVGTWRVQRSKYGGTVLTYTVRVVPKPWLPTILVESHIMEDVKLNLEAIKAFTEAEDGS